MFHIKAGTEVLPHLWSLHHDEDFWHNPYEFDPSRFLDTSTENLVLADHPNRKHLKAFGAGQRGCVAEVFARARMFLIMSRIIQNFSILPETSVEDQPSCDPRSMIKGLVLSHTPYKIRLIQNE